MHTVISKRGGYVSGIEISAQFGSPHPPTKNCAMPSKDEYNQMLGDASIRRFIGPNCAYLDVSYREDSAKHHTGKWVELEECLFEWQRKEQQGMRITGEILKDMARESL